MLGVYGGAEFVVRYPNGDESQYVMIVFEERPERAQFAAPRWMPPRG